MRVNTGGVCVPLGNFPRGTIIGRSALTHGEGARSKTRVDRRAPPSSKAEAEPAEAVDEPTHIDVLGARLRAFRKARKLSLSALSEVSGVSVAMLSHIERGKATPSLRVLEKLRGALGVSMMDLFPRSGLERDEKPLVMRPHERATLNFPEIGLAKKRLSPGDMSDLEVLLLVISPGGGSGPEAWTRPGEKAGLVLSGGARLEVGERSFDLRAGDSFQFDSSQPHRFECLGAETAEVVWIIKSHPIVQAVDA